VKTDAIFYRLFQTFPAIFFELINHAGDRLLEIQLNIGLNRQRLR
jgi:predicted transposase YdaD